MSLNHDTTETEIVTEELPSRSPPADGMVLSFEEDGKHDEECLSFEEDSKNEEDCPPIITRSSTPTLKLHKSKFNILDVTNDTHLLPARMCSVDALSPLVGPEPVATTVPEDIIDEIICTFCNYTGYEPNL